ncbi:MAG TPA: hypothetical protein VJL31_07505 [Gemmatimonadales bacterium]|jgi:hypothetical protein|nr:hypothetical protein [Gemmatimonadales bacterium]
MTRYARWLAAAIAAFSLLGLISCYRYVPAQLESVPVGSSVRALLSTDGVRSLSERTGMDNGTLSGRLVERDAQRAMLLVPWPGTGRDPGSRVLYQRVDVQVSHVARLDLRVLDKVRTGGLVAALLGAVTVIAVRAFGGGNPGSPPLDGGGTVE